MKFDLYKAARAASRDAREASGCARTVWSLALTIQTMFRSADDDDLPVPSHDVAFELDRAINDAGYAMAYMQATLNQLQAMRGALCC
ncbi:hypothetical protein [Synechococcus sp. 1G10]|uniref:hypothetical protein n=1 Tax=Synechococcus sp. 1G10 TaxID=2025605 RepID=UPI00117F54E1|nr:hypothetical protein [Synechococcus sp. 1G10]